MTEDRVTLWGINASTSLYAEIKTDENTSLVKTFLYESDWGTGNMRLLKSAQQYIQS